MNQRMPFFIFRDRGIQTFIETLIAIGDVTSGTAHAAHIAPFVPAANAEVAALTFSADVSVNGLGRIFFNGVYVHIRYSEPENRRGPSLLPDNFHRLLVMGIIK